MRMFSAYLFLCLTYAYSCLEVGDVDVEWKKKSDLILAPLLSTAGRARSRGVTAEADRPGFVPSTNEEEELVQLLSARGDHDVPTLLSAFASALFTSPTSPWLWDLAGAFAFQNTETSMWAEPAFHTAIRLGTGGERWAMHYLEVMRATGKVEKALSFSVSLLRSASLPSTAPGVPLPSRDAIIYCRALILASYFPLYLAPHVERALMEGVHDIAGLKYTNAKQEREEGKRGEKALSTSRCVTPFDLQHLPHMPLMTVKRATQAYLRSVSASAVVTSKAGWDSTSLLSTRPPHVCIVSSQLNSNKLGKYVWGMLSALPPRSRLGRPACYLLGRRHDASSIDGKWEEKIASVCSGGVMPHLDGGANEVASVINSGACSVAVYTDGWNFGHRLDAASLRPSPVQVSWLGFAGYTGSVIDYVIADRVVAPPDFSASAIERTAYLPNQYHLLAHSAVANMVSSERMLPSFLREGAGGSPFVLCNFNQHFRISSAVADAWMSIMYELHHQRHPALLWMVKFSSGADTRLRSMFWSALHHLDDRLSPFRIDALLDEWLRFTPPSPIQHHFREKAACDLFLDTFLFNGHTSVADVMWVGVPVVTLPDERWSSRVASSLLIYHNTEQEGRCGSFSGCECVGRDVGFSLVCRSPQSYCQAVIQYVIGMNASVRHGQTELEQKQEEERGVFNTAEYAQQWTRALEVVFEARLSKADGGRESLPFLAVV
mmetsp:Transcript_11067/g.29029  ORF Transcript_11067/g.29029 Transcript_11067/m.29029 type:complete len:718 (-) Transcript_11067:1833-3986(-)